MKGFVTATVLFTGAALAVASGGAPAADSDLPTKAWGNGSMAFAAEDHNVMDDQEEGRGLIQFTVQVADGKTSGSLLFAAEHHHSMLYPDIIVRVEKISEAAFSEHAVKFAATGKLHNEVVQVDVVATDGAGKDHHDSFSITCTNGSGEVAFEAQGELFSGDIVVGDPQ